MMVFRWVADVVGPRSHKNLRVKGFYTCVVSRCRARTLVLSCMHVEGPQFVTACMRRSLELLGVAVVLL